MTKNAAEVPTRDKLVFFLNGTQHVISSPCAHQTVLEFVRGAGLTGTKLGCGEGGCGACTVAITRETADGRNETVAINSCMAPLCSIDGCHVTTVEGLGSCDKPHPVQLRFAESHGSQCGFCTPGIVMRFATELANPERPDGPTMLDIEESFDGNLCRCTGYRPLLDAAKSFASDRKLCPSTGEPCKRYKPASATAELVVSTTATKLKRETKAEEWGPIPPSAVFPPTPLPTQPDCGLPLATVSSVDGSKWFKPLTLAQLLQIKNSFGTQGKIVAGNTELAILTKVQLVRFPVQISVLHVAEMKKLSISANGSLHIGGAVTLSHVLKFAKTTATLTAAPAHARRTLHAIAGMLKVFASTQIRNVGTVVGNLCNASPIGDLAPLLMAVDASVTLQSLQNGTRVVPLREFIVGYRTVSLRPDEVCISVSVPGTAENEYVGCYKMSKRRDDDISIASHGFRAVIEKVADGTFKINEFSSGWGGMAAKTITAPAIDAAVKGFRLPMPHNAKLDAIRQIVDEALPLSVDVPGGMPAYRRSLAASFLLRFLADVESQLGVGSSDPRDASILSAAAPPMHRLSLGAQAYVRDAQGKGLQHSWAGGADKLHAPSDAPVGVVGAPIRHRAALAQCTGEATYTDDIPSPANCLHAALVLSKEATGEIDKIDSAKAEKLPGFRGIFTAADLTKEQNDSGAHPPWDEEVFRSKEVQSIGQVVAVVVCDTQEQARLAAHAVAVAYKPGAAPAIVNCDDAVAKGRVSKTAHRIDTGDVKKGLEGADVVVEGEIRIGGQEHFYLEPNAVLAVPGELGEMTVYNCSQCPNASQKMTAKVLGVPINRVKVVVKRIGGGFGGKESRTVFISSPVAVAAHRLRKPVRLCLPRQEDMISTGTRHPFKGTYRVGATKDGKIVSVDVDLYSNAGYSHDLSVAVTDRALFHIDNAYKFPNLSVRGHVCLTNTVTNTAFRGFGGPQGMLVCEQFMEHVAIELGLPTQAVREINLYKPEGDVTHYGQPLLLNTIPRLWKEAMLNAEFDERRKQVDAFNAAHRWRKRGVAILPVKFGINFTAGFLNQAGALVCCYTDGTVLVSHGGTEMGQGLHTKMVQIAARALHISVDQVHITETATDKVANASPTAASASSDLNGMAILDACEQISARLQPYWAKALKDPATATDADRAAAFVDVVNMAYFDRVDLAAHGFYKCPTSGYNFDMELKPGQGNADKGTPFNYFTCGVAVSDVEIDVLSGDLRVMRSDVLMDLGNSINPAIDIGQIEGAFVQGVGWCTMEECVWGGGTKGVPWVKAGNCFTRGPGTYKIPGFADTPADFRVHLLGDAPNPRAVHSSKAVGEPPYFLAASVFFAARDAIKAARKEFLPAAEAAKHFTVDSPLTSERIRVALGDAVSVAYQQKVVAAGGAERPVLFC